MIVTTALLVLQVGGCAYDLTHRQRFLASPFCMVARERWMEYAAGLIWLMLGLSWIVGLFGLRFPTLRPAYWLLLLLIPVGLAVQAWLLQRGLLACDAL